MCRPLRVQTPLNPVSRRLGQGRRKTRSRPDGCVVTVPTQYVYSRVSNRSVRNGLLQIIRTRLVAEARPFRDVEVAIVDVERRVHHLLIRFKLRVGDLQTEET